jgi:hypothetical protein
VSSDCIVSRGMVRGCWTAGRDRISMRFSCLKEAINLREHRAVCVSSLSFNKVSDFHESAMNIMPLKITPIVVVVGFLNQC